ncbi:MAG TPA: ABC transporter ATP-binding protein, partial [Anaerolineales bacterium]|nr:ABC transporter ATP-binding protein [Anaerolineales bacterium]
VLPFEHAVSALTILLFIWWLAFPEPARAADAAAVGLAIMTVVALFLGWGMWAPEAARAWSSNGVLQETAWQAALLLPGIGLLAVRRAGDWQLGIALLTILLLDHLIPYVLPFTGEGIRLIEILAGAVWILVVGRHVRRMAPPRLRAGRSTPRTLWPYVRPYWRGFIIPVLAITASSGVSLLKPWPFKFLIDNVLDADRPVGQLSAVVPLIAAIAGSIVAIAVLQGLLSYSKEVFLSAMGQRVAFALRSALFAHIQRLPLAFHDQQRTGDLITRVTSDVTKVQELVTDDLLVGGVTNVLQLAGMLAVMLVIDWKLGLIAALSAPMLFLTTWYFRKRIRAQEQQVRSREGDITSLAQETISSIRVVKAFGREQFEAERFEEQSGAMLEAGIKVARLEARFSWVLNIVTAASLAALVGFGAYEVLLGALSVGTLVVFIQYMRDLQSPLTSLSKLSTKMARVAVRAERLAEVLNEQPAVQEYVGSRTAPRFHGKIQFERVSFRYSPDEYVLRDISFTIEPGESIAIVGATGAGKSTLVGLILRLYGPSEGSVRIDGHDIRGYKLDSFVDQISVVLQESLLFRTTIRENIAYGKPAATFKEIQEAARLAYCDEFIHRLPDGFDTVVGERGTTLSGGQRQRIAIARALIRDAPILILDEPTTGLDPESEAIVLSAVEQLMRGRTTIMITHKPGSPGRAERIFVLDQGRLVEAGTHEELNARSGPYARILQLGSAK